MTTICGGRARDAAGLSSSAHLTADLRDSPILSSRKSPPRDEQKRRGSHSPFTTWRSPAQRQYSPHRPLAPWPSTARAEFLRQRCPRSHRMDGQSWTGRAGTLTGMVSWRVENYLRYLDMLECVLDLRSIRVEQIGPWAATYWKTLPNGHRARFHWGHRRERAGLENEFSFLAFSGFCEFRDRWYQWR